jgi:nucleoside-triphosphatase THEP1
MSLETNIRLCLTGQSGTGKSKLLQWIITQYIKNEKRRYYVVIDDRESNVKYLEKEHGFYIQDINDNMVQNLDNINFKNFIKHHEKVCLIPTYLEQEDITKIIDEISISAYKLTDILLCIDEAHSFLKRGKYFSNNFSKVVRGGRKDGICSIISTHRITDIDPDYLALFNLFVSLRNTEENTLKKLNNYYNKFDFSMIDSNLKTKHKKEIREIITNNPKPIDLISKLPNRFFAYADREKGIQEITRSEDFPK